MLIIPAIDLKDGRCVRLVEGHLESEKVYSEDPAEQALTFVRAGAQRIHVVDLDGAFEGKRKNTGAIAAIIRAAQGVPVQVGGGLRDIEAVEAVFASGATYAILGTMAVADRTLFARICREHPGRIVAGIDARDGFVRTEGWVKAAEQTTLEVAQIAEDAGASAIVHTDISRDGTGRGVNTEASGALARLVAIPVIASGGVSSIEDVRALGKTKVAGVVIGRAIYEGRIDLAAAVREGA